MVPVIFFASMYLKGTAKILTVVILDFSTLSGTNLKYKFCLLKGTTIIAVTFICDPSKVSNTSFDCLIKNASYRFVFTLMLKEIICYVLR